MQFCVYMMASSRNGMLYIGVTSDFVARIWQHENNVADRFINYSAQECFLIVNVISHK